MNKRITIDLSLALNTNVKGGVSKSAINALGKKLPKINKEMAKPENAFKMAFHSLLNQTHEILEIKYLADKIKKSYENLVVIGIGGSDLGARAAIGALKSKYHNELSTEERDGVKVYFCGDTTDPQPLLDLLKVIDISKSAFQIISKSGSTVETLTAFTVLLEIIKKRQGEIKKDQIIVTTTPDNNPLHALCEKMDFTLLPHAVVGGRFSVLSSVGFLSMACAGIDIGQLIEGAKALVPGSQKLSGNPAFAYAATQFLASKSKKNITVLMPYQDKLSEFTRWFVQLCGESLGKDGMGQTPLRAIGPTDQHSMLQLFQDGPKDKIINFLIVENQPEITLGQSPIGKFSYLDNQRLSDILREEQKATALALATHGKISTTIRVPELNAFYMGQLFYFFELATAYSGELMKINAFDQPGVELSKKYLHASLGNPELLETKKQNNKTTKKIKKLII